MSNTLTPEQQEINKWIERLDEVVREVEARWGINRLPGLVTPETQVKWERQVSKLDDAIVDCDLPLVRDLAQGTIRGWAALENEASNMGAAKNHPDVWDVRSPETGNHYRVCKTLQDARLWANQPGVVVFTLEEISLILDSRSLNTQGSMQPQAAARKKPEPFDFKKGDSTEF